MATTNIRFKSSLIYSESNLNLIGVGDLSKTKKRNKKLQV